MNGFVQIKKGVYHYTFNTYYVPRKLQIDTVAHEVAHAVEGMVYGKWRHSPRWKKIYETILNEMKEALNE